MLNQSQFSVLFSKSVEKGQYEGVSTKGFKFVLGRLNSMIGYIGKSDNCEGWFICEYNRANTFGKKFEVFRRVPKKDIYESEETFYTLANAKRYIAKTVNEEHQLEKEKRDDLIDAWKKDGTLVVNFWHLGNCVYVCHYSDILEIMQQAFNKGYSIRKHTETDYYLSLCK